MTTLLKELVLGQVSDEVAALAERVQDSLVLVRTRGGGSGSGIVWRGDGLIVTNHHVVPRERAEVVFRMGGSSPATVIARDPRRDLAALQVETDGLTPAPIGDSARLRVGELVVAVGNPLGLRGAATVGVVSGIGRRFGAQGRRGQEVIQADVMLAPGNSGGPLLNAAGQVVGINSMILSPGMALAVPSRAAQDLVAGQRHGALLGVSVQDVALPAIFQEPAHREHALLLSGIVDGSPADEAGLLPGDLLLALDGTPVQDASNLLDRLEDHQPGVTLLVEVLRGGQPWSVAVTPVAQ